MTGPVAAYVFALYAIQVVWTILAAGGCLVGGDRKTLSALAHTPGLTGDSDMPPSLRADMLSEPPPSIETSAAGH